MTRTTVRAAFAAIALLCLVGPARAEDKPRASPHEDVSATVGGKKVTISYGRPFKKGREVWGALVPWDQVWRTGADEATTLTTEGDITIGDLKVPAGTYALFTVPSQKKDWLLVVNKTAKQWGAFKYDEKQDLGRTKLKTGSGAAPVEQFTITLAPDGKNVTLKLAWDTVVASTTIKP